MVHILLVDDQPYMEALLAGELDHKEYRLTCAEDRDAAMACLDDGEPDLILLDLFLQGFEGWDVLRDIKRRLPQVPVLILSAYEAFKDDPRLRKAAGYVVKDSDTGPLLGKIHEVLDFRSQSNPV